MKTMVRLSDAARGEHQVRLLRMGGRLAHDSVNNSVAAAASTR